TPAGSFPIKDMARFAAQAAQVEECMPEFLTNPVSLLREATQHLQAGRLAEAEAIYRRILQADPRQPDALHYLGLVAGQVKQFDAAVNLIQQSLTVSPKNASAWSNLGL